jgi:predicted transcriptional regulator
MPRRPREENALPPPLEIACLAALWEIGSGNVHAVREKLGSDYNLAYTTVMTLLDRLHRRGELDRVKSGRSFVYTPVHPPERIRRAALEQFLALYFNRDAAALMPLLENAEPRPPLAAEAVAGMDTTLL